MKMLMIVVDSAKREELEVVLEQSGVVGYTEITAQRCQGLLALFSKDFSSFVCTTCLLSVSVHIFSLRRSTPADLCSTLKLHDS